MKYKDAIEYIENTGKFGMNLGLERIERLCELLGNPEKSLKVVHVAGTNGKGSTATFVANVLGAQGYRVGIYTSPYIERFTERIKINDMEIKEAEVVELVENMLPLIEQLVAEGYENPTEFEIITAAAFKYFYDKSVDYVVLEVGLGGRFDATNVVTPMVSVITTISYDHMHILGNTLAEIAGEKAGIIKPGIPVVVYPQEAEAMEILEKKAGICASKLYLVESLEYEVLSDTENGIVFNVYSKRVYRELKIKLLGKYQVLNALTALRAIEVLEESGVTIAVSAIYKGFETASWPGRFEIISREPYIVLDGGHNVQGINSITDAIKKYFENRVVHIVCGMLKDKNYNEMLSKLLSISNDFITVAPDNPRALSSLELAEAISELGGKAAPVDSIRAAVVRGLEATKEHDVLLFCGSLYMIGEARTILKSMK